MNKILRIEQAIQALEGGAFQNLCDAYLYKKRKLENINPLGMLIGTNRVKIGTPDTFSRKENGELLFVECSLQQKGLFEKISGDLKKCFDKSKTNIATQEIDEIIYCYSSILTPAEEQTLQKTCSNKGVVLSLFSIGTISFDLYYKYPRIAKEFLGIEVDSGQIVTLEEFMSAYGSNKFTVPLDTTFHFRDEELAQIDESLATSSLVVVTGQAGVGKSRLVLEACRNFSSHHTEYKVFAITNRSQDLFADLRDYFSEPGHFLIFVDDANRITNFAYFVDLLQRQRPDQTIKVLVTVRNYAIEKIREISKEYKSFREIRVEKFNNDEIKKLVSDELNILNNDYLERIVNIAKGNPRLAIMAGRIAVATNRLESINDVSSLYDEYFSSIQKDINNLANSNILKTAGVLSFYRAVDRLNGQQTEKIYAVFGINQDEFWDAIHQLHEMEIVDIHENEVAKMSDQVLSTYLFYTAFFKKKVLDFSLILQNFFPNLKERIIDSLNPVASAFDRSIVESVIRPPLEQMWQDLLANQDQGNIIAFSQMFWPLLQTQVLDYIRLQVEKLETQVLDTDGIKFQPDSHSTENSLIKLLGAYGETDTNHARIALQILLEYANKLPKEIPAILKILIEDYGYTRHIHQRGPDIQQLVVDELWQKSDGGNQPLYSELLIAVSEKYLHTYISTNEMKDERVFTIYNFQIPARPDIFDFRKSIWEKLFQLYKVPSFQRKILDLLHNYGTAYHHVSEKEIIAKDADLLLLFIRQNLEPHNYPHDVFVQDYLDFLEHSGSPVDEKLRQEFSGETYKLHELIFGDKLERKNYSYEEHQKIKKERFESYFENCSLDDFKKFLVRCITIREGLNATKNTFDFGHSVLEGFIALSTTNPSVFPGAIEYYLGDGERLALHAYPILRKMIVLSGREHTLEVLHKYNFPSQEKWVFAYYQVLPTDNINSGDAENVDNLYKEANLANIPYDLDYLLHYRPFREKLIPGVVATILEKGDDLYCPVILAALTNPHTEINKQLLDVFKEDMELLKKVYFFVLKRGKHDDYDSSTLLKLIRFDISFFDEYLEHMYTPTDMEARWNYRDPDFSVLWTQENYEKIINKAVEFIYKREKFHDYSDLRKFFLPSGEESAKKDVLNRQDSYCEKIIKARCKDINFISLIFDVICEFSESRRIKLISVFLDCNKVFSDFKELRIEPRGKSWSGSQVPVIQEEIDFLEKVLAFLNTVDLLPHRNYIEQRINGLKKHLKSTIKREFIED